jgi:hypothetical protein
MQSGHVIQHIAWLSRTSLPQTNFAYKVTEYPIKRSVTIKDQVRIPFFPYPVSRSVPPSRRFSTGLGAWVTRDFFRKNPIQTGAWSALTSTLAGKLAGISTERVLALVLYCYV